MVTKTDNIISDDQGNVEVIEHVDKHVIVDQKGNEVDKYEENTTEIPETDQKVPIFVDVPGKNKDENLLFIEAVSEDESQSIENNEEDWWGLSLPLALLGASGLAICYMVYTKSKTINYRLLSKDADALV
ncbi:hypothetical protein ROZALSC1DRAFT_27631 [Rozella allomycis CSF55]|uniref:Uncharacterized protein n=1 Tax=Rozella allomycis (strain CSF55) TaxID=988480 RepID=A0A075AXA1_ROZAC|nr:hypothetical protein O9G_001764 [Rozella allomycis CSF55]RKP20918.1 hypothetical protein ROZALSC1DRAFT_27631 [Rozella allomycis CSF55]|eukprot:EPZ33352.1 hypothetical protein O9G_001764 [Rozella allomycis CSF55]